MGYSGDSFIYACARSFGVILGSLLVSVTAVADEAADLRPSWIANYAVWSGRADLGNINHSYLQNREVGLIANPFAEEIAGLVEHRRALEWRQQYDDMSRDYENKQRAGLVGAAYEQAHTGAVSGFSRGIFDEIRNRKIRQTGNMAGEKVVREVEKSDVAKSVLAPGAIVAGVWIGRSVRLRMNDDMRFVVRTSLRDRNGQIEFQSSILNGAFEYHPQAPNSYSLINSGSVDFARMMDLNHVVDFQSERYQFKVTRAVPFFDLGSSVLYASSSNVLAGSLTKQLTGNLAAVVDSIHYLVPVSPDRAAEQRVRLKYDVHF